MKESVTTAAAHRQYQDSVSAFRRWIPDPTLRMAFSREADGYFRRCALGVWQADNAVGITPRHVEFYNAIYSGTGPAPSALYWEVATGVADYDLFQPPAFFAALRDYDRRKGTTLARRFTDQLTLLLLLFAAVDGVVSEAEAGFVNACSDTLMALCERDGLSGDRPALKADEFVTHVPAPAQPPTEVVPAAEQEETPLPESEPTLEELLARLYHAIGVLPKGQLVEVDRSGLVAGFVGQTALKTQEVIQKAIGGVLFIDEAYALVNQDNGNDFGREVIEVLLKNMEDHRKDLVVIVAGYSQLMEKFIHSNPGLESRFNKYFYFEDYDGAQLFTILQSMCVKNGYVLTPEGEALARRELMALYEDRDENFGNARDVRNLFEQAVARQSDRVARLEAPTREQLMALRPEDLAEPGDASSPQGAMEV